MAGEKVGVRRLGVSGKSGQGRNSVACAEAGVGALVRPMYIAPNKGPPLFGPSVHWETEQDRPPLAYGFPNFFLKLRHRIALTSYRGGTKCRSVLRIRNATG